MEAPTKRVEIIPAKRRALILEHLRINGAASIQELADSIGGSQSTIRRDLEHLMEGGYLERTHGGALLVPPLQATFERESQINAHMQRAQKIAIGAEAALRINNRESVIFEASSTVMEVVRAAALRDLSLTVVTNSLEIAQVSSDVPSWRVIMPGGTIRPGGWRSLWGEPGESFFNTVHADVCVTGAYAVSGNVLTDAALEVASLKRKMIQSSRRTIVVVDSSKFSAPSFSTFCELSAIDELITDDGIKPEYLEALHSYGTKVTVVPMKGTAPR
ncbi:DeoR/GlpR transcriptional regulator [Labrys sp. LIt4]|uniref:DeoR/GlpR family DNA-binding transcription regulator n=1 Tax=Labrys sp. LIt4 TaxID=2821355 RepID=UPI001ADFE872|nr:DeoR/GlpR family DNA-binding transcription regulator [Labrys sp. LIt4]MBP0579098.1 DeoR/GlpR transcriptional regulator [Labrys sp. LIt4]